MKMTISVGRCLKRNTMLVWVMEYINKDLANCKSLRKVQELYTAFKKNTSRCKYWVLKVLWLEAQMLCSGWLKKDSLCLRLQLSSKCYVASRCNGLRLGIQRPDQEDHLQPWEQQMHHASVWILSGHCNSERIFWSGTQRTWRWLEI